MHIDLEQFRQFCEQGIPFNRHLGMQVVEVAHGRVKIIVPFREELVGDVFRPALHGGVIAALIDAAAGAAVLSQITPRDRASTLDLRIDYLRPAPKRDLVALAELRRIGNRTAVANVIVTALGDESEPVAEGRGVFSIRRDVGDPQAIE
jgi:uncharacterized protein (TIGR00369 family)